MNVGTSLLYFRDCERPSTTSTKAACVETWERGYILEQYPVLQV